MMITKIKTDIMAAMKAKEAFKLSTLRMLLCRLDELYRTNDKATDNDAVAALRKEIKQHQDAFEGFKLDDRQGSMAAEMLAIEILNAYLPKQLSQDEITKLIDEAIAEVGTPTRKQMGQVMKIAVAKANGQVATSILSTEIGLRLPTK